ncbi:MAG TPA: helix-turn-helix domain-containing protein, partial [Anaerolineales bacterium]
MDLVCEERPSDSPLVENIWRSQNGQAGSFISMAESQFSLVVTTFQGRTFVTLRGPSTSAAPAFAPAGAEFVGIDFKPGVFMPALPAGMLAERRDLSLPEATGAAFWLQSSVWQYPNYENADTFVNRLARGDLLACDPVVTAVLHGRRVDASVRTVRRRFLKAAGLTHGSIYQIERARHATRLLKQGVSILDTVARAGYFDQPHLTRSLKRYIGLTPAQIIDEGRSERLSFLYKTGPFSLDMMDLDKDTLQPQRPQHD